MLFGNIESLPWLLEKISGHSMSVLESIKKPPPKLKKHMDPNFVEKETLEHNEIVSGSMTDIVFCYDQLSVF